MNVSVCKKPLKTSLNMLKITSWVKKQTLEYKIIENSIIGVVLV